MKALRITLEVLAIILSPILGIIVGLRIYGHVWEIDENIFLHYMCPGAVAGLFLSVAIILYLRKKLSFFSFCGLLLGALAGTGSAVLLGDPILDTFEPPGSDLLFMLLYPTFFGLCGMAAGFFIARKTSHYLKSKNAHPAG